VLEQMMMKMMNFRKKGRDKFSAFFDFIKDT